MANGEKEIAPAAGDNTKTRFGMRKTRVRTRQSRRRWIGRPVSVHQTNKLPHAATYGCTTSQGGFATERPASPSLRRLPPALAPLCAKFSLSAAAAASSERQTIRQTPASALPCLARLAPMENR
jgi:hypothetical protein